MYFMTISVIQIDIHGIYFFFLNRNFRIVIKYIVIIFAFLKVIRYFCEKEIEKFNTSNVGDLDFNLNVL